MIGSVIDPEETIAEIVLRYPECAPVLQRHHLEFCCAGEQRLSEACGAQKVALAEVLAELRRVVAARAPLGESNPAELSTDKLAHYLRGQHAYLRQVIGFVQQLARSVAETDGPRDPRLDELSWNVRDLAEALLPHLDQEDRMLQSALEGARDPALPNARACASLEEDHAEIGELLSELRLATGDFHLPSWAGLDQRTLFFELEALEGHLMRAVHLENHILLPRLG